MSRKPAKPVKPSRPAKPSAAEERMRERISRGGLPEAISSQTRGLLLNHAIVQHESGASPGNKSSVYRLPMPIVYAMAYEALVNSHTLTDVIKVFAPDLREHGVSDKAVRNWLPEVRRRYHACHYARIKELTQDEEALKFVGDPASAVDTLIARAMPVVIELLRRVADQPPKDQYPTWRAIESIAMLTKVAGEYGVRVQQTRKLSVAVSKLAEEASKSVGGAVTLDKVRELFRDVAGYDITEAQTPVGGKEAA